MIGVVRGFGPEKEGGRGCRLLTADARFLRRILIGLILATVLAGAATGLVTVEAASPALLAPDVLEG